MEFQIHNPGVVVLSWTKAEKQFMRTGEMGFLSSPLPFDVSPPNKISCLEFDYHEELCMTIQRTLMLSSDFWPSRAGVKEDIERYAQFRISLIGNQINDLITENGDDEQADFEKSTCDKVKVRIFSAIPQNLPGHQEQGLLTKLAKILGETNLRLKIGLRMNPIHNNSVGMTCPTECTWNEATLAWEAEAQIKLRKRVNQSEEYIATLESLEFVLNDTALNKVIRMDRVTHGVQERSNFLTDLEDEAFTDMSITGSNGVAIKCHRILVAGASPVFAAMFNENTSNLREAKTGSLEIQDMSEEGIRSMLRFIYSKDCMALCTSVDITLELLQAGHKYLMTDLIQDATCILMVKPNEWFNVDSAVDLFCFSRNIRRGNWEDLVMKSTGVLKWFHEKHQDKLAASSSYNDLFKRIYQTAKIRPEFANAVFGNVVGEEESPSPAEDVKVSKEDVILVLDFVTGFAVEKLCENVDLVLQTLLFSYKCDADPPALASAALNLLLAQPNEWFQVDAAVAIFCLAIQANDQMKWEKVKMKSVEVLKHYHLLCEENTLNSKTYKDMFEKNYKAALEFTRLCIVPAKKK